MIKHNQSIAGFLALRRLARQKSMFDYITIGEVINAIGSRSFYLVLVALSIPLCLPIPHPPGFSTIISIPMIITSFQMLIGFQSLKLGILGKVKIKLSLLNLILRFTKYVIKKLSKFLQKRLLTYLKTRWFIIVCSIFILCMAILLILPIPLIGILPSLAICCVCIGLSAEDGYVVIGGLACGFLAIFIDILTFIFGKKILSFLF